jgi:hypothetical protein
MTKSGERSWRSELAEFMYKVLGVVPLLYSAVTTTACWWPYPEVNFCSAYILGIGVLAA